MNDIRPVQKQRSTTRFADGLPRIAWTVEEFDSLSEHGFFTDDDRIELIGGELVPMSPKGNRHEAVRGQLGQWLARNVPLDFNVYIEPGWRADPLHYLEPDVLIFPSSKRLDALAASEAILVLEIAHSSLGYDAGRKATIYASLGVREYWVVNAVTLETRIHRSPDGGAYSEVSVHSNDALLTPVLLPGLNVRLVDLGIG